MPNPANTGGAAKPSSAGFDHRAGEREQRCQSKRLPRRIETSGGRLGIRYVAPREPDAGEADWHIDQEDAAPTEPIDQHPAQHRPRRQRDARRCRPKADGAAARRRILAAGLRRQGQRARHQQRGADTLGGTGDDQQSDIRRHSAAERGQHEEGETSDIDTQPADAVAEGAGGKQQRGEGDGVGIHHPLEAGHVGVERAADGHQRDVEDRDVELHQDEAEAGYGDNHAEAGRADARHAHRELAPEIGG